MNLRLALRSISTLLFVSLGIAPPVTAQVVGPTTHLEFALLHEETVATVASAVSGSNPGEDGTNRVEDLVFVDGVHGTHRVNLVAEVDAQTGGAPRLRALGEHEFHLTGSDRRNDVWTLVDADSLLRATLVDELTIDGLPAGSYSVEFFWDVHGFDDVLIDLAPGDSLYAFINTRVRLEARNAGESDFYQENIPWPSGYRDTDLDQRKTVDEYVAVELVGSSGQPLSVETIFEVEPDTRLDNVVELPGTALVVDGEHSGRFDESAELIGILVRDAADNILSNVTVSSASGYVYPVLDEAPVAPLPHRTLLSPVAVVGNSMGEYNASVPTLNMINHSGLVKPFTSAVTGFDTYFDFSPTPNGLISFVNNWQSQIQTTLPFTGTVDFDLGGTWWIDRVAFWNVSLEDIRVSISDSPTGPWQEIGQYRLQNRLFYFSSYPHEIVDLGGEYEASYLRIQVDSAYKSSVSNTFAYGIVGELAVSAALTPLPEPGSGLLAAAGFLGLVGIARGRRRMHPSGERTGRPARRITNPVETGCPTPTSRREA